MEKWTETHINPKYLVSTLGRVKNIKGNILKPYTVKSTGYAQIRVGGRKKHSVHRLVACSFCTGFFDGAVVNHKNGIRDDNRADNLEWVTQSENIKHGYGVLGAIPEQAGKTGHNHHTSKPVWSFCLSTEEETYYECAYDARHDGFDSGQISRCCNGQAKTHKGRLWQFALEGTHRAYAELNGATQL